MNGRMIEAKVESGMTAILYIGNISKKRDRKFGIF